MRQTIVDIARAARVSTATVDRVLNERPGVRGPTRARVLAAARAIGYLPDAEPAPARKPVHLDFVLQSGPNTFMDLLAGHLADLGDGPRGRGRRARPSRRRLQPGSARRQPARSAGAERRRRHHRRSITRSCARRSARPRPPARRS